ncbi:hypothetical protein ACJ41O_009005 [Fusarium nematophilum]
MRLLRRKANGAIELTNYPEEENLPKYAVLSHTWLADEEEVTFKDMMRGNAEAKPASYRKIRFCGEQAASDGLEHFWVDTCCINKTNSSELQEAITKMFSWYRSADKCYAYLADVSVDETPESDDSTKSTPPPYSWELAFRRSRWFTRGWTLQELLAPASVEFFSVEGTRLGDRASLEQWIHEITGVPRQALQGRVLTAFSVAERFSWAENRQTQRKEDQAYCLLGIFNIFMPLIYGEGGHAFVRLREEIEKKEAMNARRDQILSTLPIASEAAFDSPLNQHESTCLTNTRADLLQETEDWVNGDDERCIFWLYGIAGTGKSTIARTIARTYRDRDKLGASFFFSRGGGDLANANRLITTLAWQLAERVPSMKPHICEAITEQKNIADQPLRDQWNRLIRNPLSKISNGSAPSTVVLVVDALDECDSERDTWDIPRVLATAGSLRNVRLRIFITSRPEIPIRYGRGQIPEVERQAFIFREILPTVEDLSLFFDSTFSIIREQRGFPEDWPGIRVTRRLVEISHGLFIWASTAGRFIGDGRRPAKRQTSTLLNGHYSSTGPQEQLDQMYISILQDSIPQDYSRRKKAQFGRMQREVLGSIVVLLSPLSIGSLANLLNIPLRDIKATLADLDTILHIPDETSHPVRLYHHSFRDFLLDHDRCSDLDFWVDEKQVHKALADSCVMVMSRMLRMDICGLGSLGTRIKDIDPGRIEQCIPPELQYACLYWVQHYLQSGTRLSDGDRAHLFLQKYFRNWLEAVNLIGKSSEMGVIMRLYHSLLEPAGNKRQMSFVKDARRFIHRYQSTIKETPLEIYFIIPLPNSELRHHFPSQMHPWINETRISAANLPMVKDEFNYVNDLAFSPDGKQIASGSTIAAVRLWDVATRAALFKLEGPMDKVSSVAISPDGKTIAAGLDDYTVMAWDMRTRAMRYILKAHSRWVNSVVFSPDGKVLASGSMDETVALWDVATGQELRRFDNQSRGVNSITFSPDGSLIATGSVHPEVRLWNVSNGLAELHMVLNGHSGCVNCVKFSPDGKHIISGSDDMTIKIWDVATGIIHMTLKGHTKRVMAVTFSLDAHLIVSGSEDTTVRVWDNTSGNLLHMLKDHTSGINAITFSPDGQLLASGSFDDEVRLWDTKNWALRGELQGFEDDTNTEMMKGGLDRDKAGNRDWIKPFDLCSL